MYQPPHLRHPGGPGAGAGYTSPPPPPDVYRSSAYQAFSPSPPPPGAGVGGAFSPMSSGSRYQQFSPAPTSAYPRQQPPQQRYPAPPQNGYPSGGPPGQQRYKGTLAPGTIVTVADQQVRVEKYLSEGGYAHVYLTRSERPIYPPSKNAEKKGRWGERGFTEHCLKRIAFEDDSVWVDVKKEIEVMKALPPNPHLVQYLGSTHNRTAKGHEVFILMEFCAGGGIIDLLNKRLRDRLKEPEILNIFTDVCEAVAAMHALKQPLLHRDLKIENVLSTSTGSPPSSTQPMGLTFKLCDFGSTTFPSTHPPSSKVEADAQAMDLNRHTTLQYRSPEMVEPMLGLPVGLPSDVWALGVLLYKLCYYTTPFEEHGTLAIVNAKYSFPQYPVYSPRIQHLIASMLVEQPIRRPTVFDILRVAHEMSGTRPEVDYPASWSKEISRSTATSPTGHTNAQAQRQSSNLLDFSSPASTAPTSPAVQSHLTPDIQPQRRGRPTREGSSNKLPPMPQPPAIPSPAPVQPKMQVTGERMGPAQGGRPTPSAQSSVDAFGLPSTSAAQAPAPKTQGSTSSGFSDSFSTTTKPFRPTSRFGRGLSQNHSGFGDSFNATGNSPQVNVQAANPSAAVDKVSPAQLEIPQTSSPARTGPQAQSQSQDQDGNFESRYPSIETLSSGDHSTPTLISPITSPHPPPNVSRPSMLGNMTGGDIKQPIQHLGIGGEPQPRSTHVTGTAFKQQQQESPRFTRSPSPMRDKKAYFGAMSSSTSAPRQQAQQPRPAEDLMTGQEHESMGAGASAPLITRTGSSAGPSRSPTRIRTRTPPAEAAAAALADPDSSDDEQVPESATAAHHPYGQLDEEGAPTGGGAHSDSLPPIDQLPSTARPAGQTGRARPQTMNVYASPTKTETDLPLPSPPTASATGSGSGRPGHVRKGSINDMVSRFEGLNPPSSYSSSVSSPAAQKSPSASASASRPTPAPKPKPAQLKKPTLDTVRVEGTGQLQNPIMPTPTPAREGHARSSNGPPKPQKPLGLSPTTTTAAAPPPGKKSFGETPRPDGFSRSSSGRSFPIVKPKPGSIASSTTSLPPQAQQDPGSGPPERQQSVKAMAARWNQGDVGAKPVVKPKPVL